LKYAKNLEEGWISRQEKLAELSPSSLKRRRFELEAWVSVEHKSKFSDKKSFSSSASLKVSSPRAVTIGTIEEERAQVAKIIALVNKKSAEIKAKLIAKEDKAPQEEVEEELEISIDELQDTKHENERLADLLTEQILQELLAQETHAANLGKTVRRT
jgi:Mg2+ and Co2+ transporter CorA